MTKYDISSRHPRAVTLRSMSKTGGAFAQPPGLTDCGQNRQSNMPQRNRLEVMICQINGAMNTAPSDLTHILDIGSLQPSGGETCDCVRV
jgi:hypothetical protein